MSERQFDLGASAAEEMARAGFPSEMPKGSSEQVDGLQRRGATGGGVDLCAMAWSSIDNDTSRDLDQIEVAEETGQGIRIRVGVADVAGSVPAGSPLDQHAAEQGQTVYTGVRNFSMLPPELSTDLTSLNEGQPRRAVVVEFVVGPGGEVGETSIYAALVRNGAQLAYSEVGPWLEGRSEMPRKVAGAPELERQLRMQDEASQRLHTRRVADGALEFHRAEADPVVVDGKVESLEVTADNRAMSLIEELMIATNETMAQTLGAAGRSCIRRVVRSPERWQRIAELAERYGWDLPAEADSGELNKFLRDRMEKDPDHYPDVSLAVIKLMGPGEYVLAKGTELSPLGHFGLAARDYAHSTAPNRRFSDLVTQRIVKAMLAGEAAPYTDEELDEIAKHCNERDAAARKVERAMRKREMAVGLLPEVGRSFDGVVTGASAKGVYMRVFNPPVEGRIVRGEEGLDVGDKVRATLIHTDPQRAFIDFELVKRL